MLKPMIRPSLTIQNELTAQYKGTPYPLISMSPIMKGQAATTMSVDQPWDNLLDASYNHGYYILEVDNDEMIVAVYWKGDVAPGLENDD